MGFIRLTKLFVVITTACHVIHEHSSIATTIDDGHLMYLNKNGLSISSASAITPQNVIKIHYPRSAETVSITAHKPKKQNPHPPTPAPTQSPTVGSTPAGDPTSPEDSDKDVDTEQPPPPDDGDAPEKPPPQDVPISDDSKILEPETAKPSNKPSPAGKPVLITKPLRDNRPTRKPSIATISNPDENSEHQTPTKKPLVAVPTRPTRRKPSGMPVETAPTDDGDQPSEVPPFKSPTVPEGAVTGPPSDDPPAPSPSKVKAKPKEDPPANGSDQKINDAPDSNGNVEDEPPPTKEPSFSEGGGQNNDGNIGGAENINEEIANEDKTALNSAKYFSITFVLCLIFCGLLYTFRRCVYN